MNEMNEREQDAAETSYQKISRAIEENLLPELVRTSETLDNFAKKARLSDMRGIILSDAWVTGMAATMRHAQRRINEQAATIERLTAERDAARANEARWRERINAIIAIAESYECLAQNPDVETSVSQERIGFAQDIYQALGIESEAPE